VQAVQERATQCHGVDTGLPAQFPYSARDGRTGRVGGTTPRYDSHAVLEGRRGEDSLFTRAPASYQGISTPSFKGKTECIDHVCARIKLHTHNDIVNTKISATRIKSYYMTKVLNET
jgi:hypothetical protein